MTRNVSQKGKGSLVVNKTVWSRSWSRCPRRQQLASDGYKPAGGCQYQANGHLPSTVHHRPM